MSTVVYARLSSQIILTDSDEANARSLAERIVDRLL